MMSILSGERGRTLIQQVRRDRIISAAISCLATVGWHGTTLDAIAREAGISRGLISYHFAGRDDLYSAVLESVASDVFAAGAAEMQPGIDAAQTAEDKLRAYIIGNLHFVAAHRREMTALNELMPNLRSEDGTSRFGPDAEEPIIAGTSLLFEFGVSTGEFRPVNSRLLALALRQCIDGAARRVVADEDFDVDGYGAELVTLFLSGVRV